MKCSQQARTATALCSLSVVTAVAVLFSTAAISGVLSPETRKKIVDEVLQKGFWGLAQFPDGSLIQPSGDAERTASPLTERQADRALDVGEITAIGVWCAVDWKPYYLSFTQSLRRGGLTETQVAFAGVLHGVAQASVVKTLQKGGQCSDQLREATKKRLQPPRTPDSGPARTNS